MKVLIEETLCLLRSVKRNIDIIEGNEGYVMGDSVTELIEALEFEYEDGEYVGQ